MYIIFQVQSAGDGGGAGGQTEEVGNIPGGGGQEEETDWR